MTLSVCLPALSWFDILDALDLASDIREAQSLQCPSCQDSLEHDAVPCAVHEPVVHEAFALRELHRALLAALAGTDRAFVTAGSR